MSRNVLYSLQVPANSFWVKKEILMEVGPLRICQTVPIQAWKALDQKEQVLASASYEQYYLLPLSEGQTRSFSALKGFKDVHLALKSPPVPAPS